VGIASEKSEAVIAELDAIDRVYELLLLNGARTFRRF